MKRREPVSLRTGPGTGCRVPLGVAIGVSEFGVAATADLTRREAAATIAWPVRAPAERVGVEHVGCRHQQSDWLRTGER
jgi:hypothetical protein